MADDPWSPPTPLYERLETELGSVVEIYDHAGNQALEEGVMLRLSVRELNDRRSAEVYLDPVSQQQLALALLANYKDPRT